MKTRRLVFGAVAGAAYAALTMLLYPICYGPVQLRLSECLCVLPFFDPVYAVGLFVGCLIANLVSAAGILDIVFGSLATLAAGLCTAWLGRRGRGWRHCLAACAMPVLWNALIVGAVLAASVAAEGRTFLAAYALCAAEIAAGETAVLYALGLPLLRLQLKRKILPEI